MCDRSKISISGAISNRFICVARLSTSAAGFSYRSWENWWNRLRAKPCQPMNERQTARGRVTPAASCRELHDHPRTVLAYARLHFGKPTGIRGRRLVVIAHMDVNESCTCLEGGVGRLDLLRGRHRQRRIVLLARDRACDCDDGSDSAHDRPPLP
jgi:hypothetical protein